MPASPRPSGNPFPATGVSRYPPVAPLVGQPEVFERLTGLIDTMDKEEGSSFGAIYGDWGIGKTRLAHELVAEACGLSKGWLARLDDDRPGQVERRDLIKPLSEAGILPLFTTFTEVLHRWDQGIDLSTALPKAACMAMAGLAERSGEGSQVQMAVDLQAAIHALAPDFNFEELSFQVGDISRNWNERANRGFAYLQAAASRSGRPAISKLLVIIDEIETASEFTPANTPEERKAQDYPVEAQDIKTLFSAVKEEANRASLPRISFLLLCSPGVRRVATIEANERRVKEATLDKATGADLQLLLDWLSGQGYLATYPGDSPRAAFLAADRNFGWFSYMMNPIYRQMQEASQSGSVLPEDYEVLRQAGVRLGKMFRHELIADLIDNPSLRDHISRIAYHQVPASLKHLEIPPEALSLLLAYRHPYDMHVVSEVRPVRLSAPEFVRELLGRGYREESRGSTRLVGEGSAPFVPSELLNRFSTFRGAGNEDIFAFASPGEFASQVRFVTSDDLSDATVRALHAIFLDHAVAGSEPMVAPSVAFMLKFNLRWGSAFDPRWLPDDMWDTLETQVKGLSPSDRRKRVCQGTAKVLFDKPSLNSEVLNVKSPHVVVKLNDSDSLAVTRDSALLILYAADTSLLSGDLSEISRRSRAPVLLIFSSDEQHKKWQHDLEATKSQHLGTLGIPRVIGVGSREHEFLLRWSYLGAGDGYPAEEVRDRGRQQREEYHREWRIAIEEWFDRLEGAGNLLKPITDQVKTYQNFRVAYGHLAAGRSREQIQALEGGAAMSSAIDDVVMQFQTTAGGTLRLISDDGRTLVFPNLFARVLSILSTPRKIDELAGMLFYRRPGLGGLNWTKSSPVVVIGQVLGLLEELGLIEKQADERYATLDSQRLGTMLTKARDQLGSFGANPSNYVKTVQELTEPLQALAFKVSVNESQLQLLAAELSDAQAQLSQIDLESQKRVPAEQEAFLKVAGLVKRLRQSALKVYKGDAKPPAIDPYTLPGNIAQIAADGDYAVFPVEYRVRFLHTVAAAIEDKRRELTHLVSQLQAKLRASYSLAGDGRAFPTVPIDRLLAAAERDLAEENVVLPAELSPADLSANLHTYMGAGQLDKAFQRLSGYGEWLNESDRTSLWGRYVGAYTDWQLVLGKTSVLERAWDELERYFEGDPSRGQWVSQALTEEQAEIRGRVRDFAAQFTKEYPQPSLDSLQEEVDSTCRAVEELIQRAREAQEDGYREIQDELGKTALFSLQRLAKRKGVATQVPDTSSLDNLTHIEQHNQVHRLDTLARERGANLLVDANWFSLYLEVYADYSAGIGGQELVDKYGLDKLQHLNDLGAISLETRITIEA